MFCVFLRNLAGQLAVADLAGSGLDRRDVPTAQGLLEVIERPLGAVKLLEEVLDLVVAADVAKLCDDIENHMDVTRVGGRNHVVVEHVFHKVILIDHPMLLEVCLHECVDHCLHVGLGNNVILKEDVCKVGRGGCRRIIGLGLQLQVTARSRVALATTKVAGVLLTEWAISRPVSILLANETSHLCC